MKKEILSLVLIMAFIKVSVAQIKRSYPVDTLLKEWKKIESFKSILTNKAPNFSFYAALIYDGKIIKKTQMGYANREKKQLLNDKTIHLWGSVSKLFTSVAILQLLERGKLTLNDPITKYIPELNNASKDFGGFDKIKIHHLLNHHSGLDAGLCYDSLRADGIKGSPSVTQILPYLKYATIKSKPGTKYHYSNAGYSLLGLTIERISKKRLGSYMKANILKPLGMKTAHYGKSPKRLKKYLAKSYYTQKDGSLYIKHYDEDQGFQEGNGGIKSTLKDMAKFLDFLKFRKRKKYLTRYEKVLSSKLINQYYYNVDLNSPKEFYSIMIQTKNHVRARIAGFVNIWSDQNNFWYVGHGGSIWNYRSFVYFNKKAPFAIILINNVTGHKTSREAIAEKLLRRSLVYFLGTGKIYNQMIKWPIIKKK